MIIRFPPRRSRGRLFPWRRRRCGRAGAGDGDGGGAGGVLDGGEDIAVLEVDVGHDGGEDVSGGGGIDGLDGFRGDGEVLASVIDERAAVAELQDDILRVDEGGELDGGAEAAFLGGGGDAREDAGLVFVGGEDLKASEAFEGEVEACGTRVDEDGDALVVRAAGGFDDGLVGDLELHIEGVGIAGEGVLDVVGGEGHIRAGVDDDAVFAVVLDEDGGQSRRGVGILEDIAGVDALALIEGDEAAGVGVLPELAGEDGIGAEAREGDGGVRALSAGDIGIAEVVFHDGFPGIRDAAHPLHKIDVRARNHKDPLFFHTFCLASVKIDHSTALLYRIPHRKSTTF